MTTYAIAQLHRSTSAPRSPNTCCASRFADPYDGKFLVHGTTPQVIDGDFPGAIVVIALPDLERAHAWYK